PETAYFIALRIRFLYTILIHCAFAFMIILLLGIAPNRLSITILFSSISDENSSSMGSMMSCRRSKISLAGILTFITEDLQRYSLTNFSRRRILAEMSRR